MNANGPRSIEACPHRHAPTVIDDREVARCGLLDGFLGAIGSGPPWVDRDACSACVDAFPPSAEDINHVIASLLHGASESLLEGEPLSPTDRERAESFRDWAERCMPLMFPDEDDAHGPPTPGDNLGWIPLECIVPPPTRRSGPNISSWAVGVTTAPRRLPTVEYVLDALLAAGWADPVLFIDDVVNLPSRFDHLARTTHQPKVGAWPNYVLALTELMVRRPQADAYLILQDDALLISHPKLREYLESSFWPGDHPGIVSLYCGGEDARTEAGWHEQPPPWFWGALAFVFPAEIARRFLVDPDVLAHRLRGPEGGLAGIDVLVGRFAKTHAIPVHSPTPSLVQHIGHVSTLWPTARAGGARRARNFAGNVAKAEPRASGVRFLRKPRSVIGADTHRSGWPFAHAAIQPLARPGGVLFDDFIEQIFCYEPDSHAHEEPWVGIFHHPPNMPPFMKRTHALSAMIQTNAWKRSRPHLIGAIALSDYVANYLAEVVGVPTATIKHPTEVPSLRWSPELYRTNPEKQLIQIGWYLKNSQLIYQVPESPEHRRVRLFSTDSFLHEYDKKVARHWKTLGTRRAIEPWRVIEQCLVTAARYDVLLSENVVVIELLDASANNVVIECIARSTPIVVNRHPAVVEYLGDGYPLYFSDPGEIPGLLNEERVVSAHMYLESLDKSWLSAEAFGAMVRSALIGFGVEF